MLADEKNMVIRPKHVIAVGDDHFILAQDSYNQNAVGQSQVFQGNIPEVPTKEIEELEDSFYQAKDAYIKLYQESKQTGKFLVLQNYMLGSSRMYEMLNKLGNLQERVE